MPSSTRCSLHVLRLLQRKESPKITLTYLAMTRRSSMQMRSVLGSFKRKRQSVQLHRLTIPWRI